MDNTKTDLELFEELLSRIGQEYDISETLTGYDVEFLSPESSAVYVEFDENKKFQKIVPM